MYRVTGRNGKYYALEIKSIESDLENIEDLLNGFDVVMLTTDLLSLEDIGILEEEVEIVE